MRKYIYYKKIIFLQKFCMKAIRSFFIAIVLFIFSIPSLNAQTTEETDFWLTFGQIFFSQLITLNCRFNTKVSIGGGTPENLSGGSWYVNGDANMSFYHMPLTNINTSYYHNERFI